MDSCCWRDSCSAVFISCRRKDAWYHAYNSLSDQKLFQSMMLSTFKKLWASQVGKFRLLWQQSGSNPSIPFRCKSKQIAVVIAFWPMGTGPQDFLELEQPVGMSVANPQGIFLGISMEKKIWLWTKIASCLSICSLYSICMGNRQYRHIYICICICICVYIYTHIFVCLEPIYTYLLYMCLSLSTFSRYFWITHPKFSPKPELRPSLVVPLRLRVMLVRGVEVATN